MRKLISILGLIIGFTFFNNDLYAQISNQNSEDILRLMEQIFTQIEHEISEIDPDLGRIAVYHVAADGNNISPSLRQHFENRLVELLRTLQRPVVVALPETNRLKISSTDSSFSVMNTLPTPDELWRVARKLRVDAFMEGNMVYMPGKALLLNLRLNRTGSNEVLWAKSFAAYENMKSPSINPLNKSINAGLEVFQIDMDTSADSLVSSNFKNRLIHYSIYFGVYQYTTATSRLRYELRLGASFLSEGISLNATSFDKNSFYSTGAGSGVLQAPISYNFRFMLNSTLINNKNSPLRDWLAVYFAITRYFTVNMPDLTGLGAGIRSDLNSHFSLSAGFSMILGSEFESRPVESTGEKVGLKVNGVHYELFLLQYTF